MCIRDSVTIDHNDGMYDGSEGVAKRAIGGLETRNQEKTKQRACSQRRTYDVSKHVVAEFGEIETPTTQC